MLDQCANAPEMMRPLWLISLPVPHYGDSTEHFAVLEASSETRTNSASEANPLLQFRKRDPLPGSPHS